MSSSREESPDWLRSYQPPSQSVAVLSLSSDSSPDDDIGREDDGSHDEVASVSTYKRRKRQRKQDVVLIDSGGESPVAKTKKSPKSKASKGKKEESNHALSEGDGYQCEGAEGEKLENTTEQRASSLLPLVFPEKVQRSKVLLECEGESLDMSGDVGAVGRVVISDNSSGNPEMLLDLKGTVYKTMIVPSRTFCIVSFGQSEAKIEAVMNDFVQLKPCSNVFECETMIEGTLAGFTFDSDEEGENRPKTSLHQQDKSNENENPSSPKSRKRNEKSLGVARKKTKTAGKPRSAKKSQAPKNSKKSKK